MENGKGKTTSMYTFWKTSFKAPEEECIFSVDIFSSTTLFKFDLEGLK